MLKISVYIICRKVNFVSAGVTQLVEYLTRNEEVVSSSLISSSIF